MHVWLNVVDVRCIKCTCKVRNLSSYFRDLEGFGNVAAGSPAATLNAVWLKRKNCFLMVGPIKM